MTLRYKRPRKAVAELSARDPRFARLVELAGPPNIPVRPSTFETIARAITYQQLSGAAAGTIWGRVLDTMGGELRPDEVLRRRDTTLRKAGLSAAKTRSIKDLARHVVDGRLEPESLDSLDDDDVVEHLTQVKGIGPWSAHMHLIFSLGRMDVWPVGDLGVRVGLQKFRGDLNAPTDKQALPMGDAYAPYRSILAWYMWRIHDVEDWSRDDG